MVSARGRGLDCLRATRIPRARSRRPRIMSNSAAPKSYSA